MDIFFLDDSVQNGKRGGMGQLVAVGGILFKEEILQPIQDQVNAICSEFKMPIGCELKWSPSADNWIYKNLVGDDRLACFQRVLSAASELGARAIVVVFDTGRTSVKGVKALRKALDYVFERTTMHLERENRLGLMVADRPGGGKKQEDYLLESVLTTIQSGTDFVPPKQIPINIVTTSSRFVRHLQLADLIVGITTAMVGGKTKFAEPLFPLIKSTFVKNSFGYVGGTGLKLYPNELLNLYYWVLGEGTFSRVGMNTGWTLPWRDWPYFYNGDDPSPQKKG